MRKTAFIASISFVFALYILGPNVILGQAEVTGTWTTGNHRGPKPPKPPKPPKIAGEDAPEPPDHAEIEKEFNDPNKIHINFSRTSEHGRNSHGSSFAYSDLEGLSQSQTQNGNVRFRLAREAGTIEAEGTFVNGKGSGTFRFIPNRAFADAMKSRGFDFEKSSGAKRSDHDSVEERLFTATMVNVTTALADDLRSANFGDLDVGDLFKAAIFKIDGKFMAEMKATGFPNLGMEELVKARIFKIDADYVRQVKDMGFTDQGFEGLVKFRIFKVTPEFLNELKAAGLAQLDAEDIVKARIFKIDAEFIRQARAEDPNLTMEDLVQIKIGVRRRSKE